MAAYPLGKWPQVPSLPRMEIAPQKPRSNRLRRRFGLMATISVVAALSLVGPVSFAQAADATDEQYGAPVQKIAADLGGKDPAQPAGLQKRVVSGLPFTGLDVVALLAVAVALTSMGLALRRLTADRHLS
jgi:hypothetical protein